MAEYEIVFNCGLGTLYSIYVFVDADDAIKAVKKATKQFAKSNMVNNPNDYEIIRITKIRDSSDYLKS